MPHKKDHTGERFGMLVVLYETEKRGKNKKIHWMCRCDCGNEIEVCVSNLVSKNTRCCGCTRHYNDNSRIKKYSPIEANAHHAWYRYKGNGLSFDDFMRLSQLDCHYCGASPSNSFCKKPKACRTAREDTIKSYLDNLFIYNGLDRIDNTKGHVSDNLVPCCFNCNKAKGTRSYQEYLDWIVQSYNYQRKNNETV